MGTRLRVLRAKKRWSQKDLADKLGVSVISVSRWEREKVKISPLALRRIEEIEKENG
ncbi:MAG TPA: XRE family transcriptional regulator [bacterium]|nr:XRE family transcriptional regulator [bacterium]